MTPTRTCEVLVSLEREPYIEGKVVTPVQCWHALVNEYDQHDHEQQSRKND